MTEQEILEGNKLIADWMESSEKIPTDEYELYLYNKFKYEDLNYHISWNSLISVYNEILKRFGESTELKLRLAKDENCIYKFALKNFFVPFENELHINSCWLKATDLIRWYNANTPIPIPKQKQ
jgi:hypothetical protein